MNIIQLEKHFVRTRWSCSDFTHHEHHTRLGAIICGFIQQLIKEKG